jgi:hypothetical protein
MVELLTIIKALLGDSPDDHLFSPFQIKARSCSRINFSFGHFWSLTISGGD